MAELGTCGYKSVMLFCAAPRSKYVDPDTYDNVDLSPIAVDDEGGTVAVVDSAKYLGGILTTDGKAGCERCGEQNPESQQCVWCASKMLL